ncbi:Anaerobic glycerol-3-phosphate dehydrogenase subunit C [archaeon HR06]|nr:Anaerobic glycerol-3-phosphate dehydrogenase subunit C [archaeon HR06]
MEGILIQDLELKRQLFVCYTCRLCTNLCPFFPKLYETFKDNLSFDDYFNLADLCYQCKICYHICPYKDPHPYKIDIPKLLLNVKALKVKKKGLSLEDRLLGRIYLESNFPPNLINFLNERRIFRKFLDEFFGISKDRILPKFSKKTFKRIYQERRKKTSENKLALFYTCYVNLHEPDLGLKALEILENCGFEVILPEQKCCGMPLLDGGDLENFKEFMLFNIKALKNLKIPIVTLSPTCHYVLTKDYPPFQEIYYITDFLLRLKEKGKLNMSFKELDKSIAYHAPCHLRASNLVSRSLQLLKLIPKVKVKVIEACSGMDGTWGLKKKYFPLSLKIGEKLVSKIGKEDLVVSDCPLSSLQIKQILKVNPLHPIEVLYNASL